MSLKVYFHFLKTMQKHDQLWLICNHAHESTVYANVFSKCLNIFACHGVGVGGGVMVGK